MKAELIGGAGWVTALSRLLLMAGGNLSDGSLKSNGLIGRHFRGYEGTGTEHLLTGYFDFFILSAVFNAFNTRTEKLNIFDSIGVNRTFLRVMGAIAAVQVIMTYLGGKVLGCYGLNLREWLTVLVMSLSVIPVDMIRKAVVSRNK